MQVRRCIRNLLSRILLLYRGKIRLRLRSGTPRYGSDPQGGVFSYRLSLVLLSGVPGMISNFIGGVTVGLTDLRSTTNACSLVSGGYLLRVVPGGYETGYQYFLTFFGCYGSFSSWFGTASSCYASTSRKPNFRISTQVAETNDKKYCVLEFLKRMHFSQSSFAVSCEIYNWIYPLQIPPFPLSLRAAGFSLHRSNLFSQSLSLCSPFALSLRVSFCAVYSSTRRQQVPLKGFADFRSPWRQIQIYYVKLSQDLFLPHTFDFIIHWLFYHFTLCTLS
jgi:hypothetical protein